MGNSESNRNGQGEQQLQMDKAAELLDHLKRENEEQRNEIKQLRAECNQLRNDNNTLRYKNDKLKKSKMLVAMEHTEEKKKKNGTKNRFVRTEFDVYWKRCVEDLPLIKQKLAMERQLYLDGLKQQMVKMARKYNMDEETRLAGNEENDDQLLFWMPLELHCELFAWLPFKCLLRLVPTLCRGIWAVKGAEMGRKWESMNRWYYFDSLRIEVSNYDRTVKKINAVSDYVTVRAKNLSEIFISRGQCSIHRIYYYFEVTVDGYFIKIGLCDANFPLRGKLVGKAANSFGISSGGGLCIEGHWNINDNWKFGKGDVIGCGMELFDNNNGQCRQMFFTKNGTILVKPFPLPLHANNVELFPAVTLWCKGHEIQANFGHEPFEYDLTQHPTTN